MTARAWLAIAGATLLSSCSLAVDLEQFDRGGTPSSCDAGDAPRMSTLTDDFNGQALAEDWVATDCALQSGGEIVASPEPGGADYCLVGTARTHRLSCDALTLRAKEVTAPELGAQTFIYVSDAGGDEIDLILEKGNFYMGDDTPVGAYDVLNDIWWRLREAKGLLVFETSKSGTSDWRSVGQLAPTFSLDAVHIRFGAGTRLPVAKPGRARFDCFNVEPPCP